MAVTVEEARMQTKDDNKCAECGRKKNHTNWARSSETGKELGNVRVRSNCLPGSPGKTSDWGLHGNYISARVDCTNSRAAILEYYVHTYISFGFRCWLQAPPRQCYMCLACSRRRH
jgi:hypothetical protein